MDLSIAYRALLNQMAGEAYLEGVPDLSDAIQVKARLLRGNTDLADAGALLDWYSGNETVSIPAFLRDTDLDDPSTIRQPERVAQTVDGPALTTWELTNALLQYHLATADEAALGGEPGFGFGGNLAMASINVNAAQELIGAPGFGSEAQSLRSFTGLGEGFVSLG